MRILIIMLISLNCFADVKVDIVNLKGKTFSFSSETQQKADKLIADNIANDSWGKKERWVRYRNQSTCLVIEDVMTTDLDIPIVSHQRCRMPVEYTITQTDITQQVNEAKAEREADELEISDVKKILKNIPTSPTKRAILILFKKTFGK